MNLLPPGAEAWSPAARDLWQTGESERRRARAALAAPLDEPMSAAIDYSPPGEARLEQALFTLKPFDAIHLAGAGDWTVKNLVPARGLGVIYGSPGARKSFIALDLALAVAEGRSWAGRKTKQGAAIYIAAEGAGGFAKRIVAYANERDGVDVARPFFLIEAAPRLGVVDDEVERIVASVEAAGVADVIRLILIDTLSQTLAGGDENGEGMTAVISSAQRIAARLGCAVLLVHHAGKDAERGMRGHSSLLGAADFVAKAVAADEPGVTTLSIEKVKDAEAGQALTVHTRRVVIGVDEDGEDIASLVVDSIEEDAPTTNPAPREKSVPPQTRLFMAVLHEAIADKGYIVRPFSDGPEVRAVDAEEVRSLYYGRLPNEATATGKRQAFHRAQRQLAERQNIASATIGGKVLLWTL